MIDYSNIYGAAKEIGPRNTAQGPYLMGQQIL
jgi:hypothetical protein